MTRNRVGNLAIPVFLICLITMTSNTRAATHEIDLTSPLPAQNLVKFSFGTAVNPNGVELAADGVSLLKAGRRVTPVMGEIHYARYPRGEWRDELLKMKAGGVDVIASYVFWIHHEEIEGQWDWTGDRDLHTFVSLCGELGLSCIIRCGPWDHGEVRNGGFPEWLLDKHLKLRTDDPGYLAEVKRLYSAIAGQLHGLLWKDGGPVIGIQIENEYGGHPEHLLSLKQIAIDAGLDVPIYTRTGWPELSGHMPFGELLPLYGGYAEGFWDRQLEAMPARYWKEFVFKLVRTDAAIATDHFGNREAHDEPDVARYPYLTCEIGPGMPCSYHRRITVFPMDVLSMVMTKLGSGSNWPGYYMYHGGTNPAGHEPWLQEHQDSRYTNWNDLPVKSYDFQTALGEFGQVREQYHLLRPVHLFLRDFGDRLASMAAVLPTDEVRARDDTQTFRWAVRTDGHSGFVFVNNYQRLLPQPSRAETPLKLRLKDGELTFPQTSTPLAADGAFCWPFNFDLGDGITLRYATAQLICQVRDNKTIYTVFAETGNPAEFAIVQNGKPIDILRPTAGTAPAVVITANNGITHKLILLDEKTAKTCYKGLFAGEERLVVTPASVMFDNGDLRIISTDDADVQLALLPAPSALRIGDRTLSGVVDGAFTRYTVPVQKFEPVMATIQAVREAGLPRTIQIGKQHVAMEPTDAEFDQAAAWNIALPSNIDPSRKLLLRIHYTGDVARAYLGDRLLTDDFYNGTPFDVGLNRYGPDALKGISVKILPLQKDAPIYMLDSVRPDFGKQSTACNLSIVDVVESHEVRLTGR